MRRGTLTGTQDSVNLSFTLGTTPAAGSPILLVHNGVILDEETGGAAPAAREYTRSGNSITLVTAPAAADNLYYFYVTSGCQGLKKITLRGTKNGTNTSYTLSEAPASGTNVFLAFNTTVLNEVSAGPTATQFTISSTAITLGLAPNAADVLEAWVEDTFPETFLFRERALVESQNGTRTEFTFPSLGTQGFVSIYIVTFGGVVMQVTTSTSPTATQYYLVSNSRIRLGTAPAAGDIVKVYEVGVVVSASSSTAIPVYRDVVLRVQLFINEQLDYEETKAVVDEQFRMLLQSWQYSFAKQDGVVTIRPSYTTGTIAVERDCAFVYGTSTGWETSLINSYLLYGDDPYKITDVDETNQILTLSSPMIEATATGKSYTIFSSTYELDKDVNYLLSITGRDWALEERTQSYFNWIDPDRDITGDPFYYAYAPPSANGITRIEFWPTPLSRYTCRYIGLKRAALASPTQILGDFSDVLFRASIEAGCLMVAMKKEAAKPGTGAFWRAMATDWYQRYQEALREFRKMDALRFGRNRRRSGAGVNWDSFVDRDTRFAPD
mgnify:FL=1